MTRLELSAMTRRRGRRREAAPLAGGSAGRPERETATRMPSTEGGFLVASWLSRSARTRRR